MPAMYSSTGTTRRTAIAKSQYEHLLAQNGTWTQRRRGFTFQYTRGWAFLRIVAGVVGIRAPLHSHARTGQYDTLPASNTLARPVLREARESAPAFPTPREISSDAAEIVDRTGASCRVRELRGAPCADQFR